MIRTATTALIATLLLVPGCDVFSDDDECRYVSEPDYSAPYYPGEELRNPDTGQCEFYGGGGGGGGGGGYYVCDGDPPRAQAGSSDAGPASTDPSGPSADPIPGALPAWAVCYGSCSGLDEVTCLDTAGCQAAYTDLCYADGSCGPETGSFYECWDIAPWTDETLPCAQISDAQTCSGRDDCVKVHYTQESPGGDAGFVNSIGNYATCAPEPGTTNPELGQCYGAPSCDTVAPNCPSGTLAGHNGTCWTGYCIPVADCEAPPACDTLASELQCISGNSCTPIYEGQDCECNGLDCTCASWDFLRCE